MGTHPIFESDFDCLTELIMEKSGILVLQVNSIEGNGKVHRFRLRQNDSMKKLIEKYAEMENVIPEAIQLIFKGNPVTKDDTPNKLEITSEDILEVCKVPGIFIPAKKPSTPSPAEMDESIEEIPSSNSPELKSVIASNFPPFVNFLNNNRLPSSPSPAKMPQQQQQHQSHSDNSTLLSGSTATPNSNHLPNNNHITVKRITELEFELGHTKIKNKDLTQVVQM